MLGTVHVHVSHLESRDLETLNSMVEDVQSSNTLYWPSPYWQQLISSQLAVLRETGFSSFKRTLNMQYFSWDLRWILTFLLFPVMKYWLRNPKLGVLRECSANFERPSPGKAPGLKARLINWVYGFYLVLLNRTVRRIDTLGLLDRCDEPLVGDPIIVNHSGRRISQDLCNSTHEFYSSLRGMDSLPKSLNVLELGAGYGRLGYVFLSGIPDCKYTVVDIPPALFISQKYLSKIFPDKKVFLFRPFSSYDEIREEFEAAQIRFIAAAQIELLPSRSVDLFINVSSFHEMTRPQIEHYFGQVGRLTKSFFYTKQWKKSRTAGLNQFTIKSHEYPVPKQWSTVYHESHPLHPWFFHALYRLS